MALNSGMSHKAFNWIDGSQCQEGPLRESIDPATYNVIAYYPVSGLQTAKSALAAASKAFRQTMWAHDHEYGLSASIWTRDVDRSLRVAQALEAGSVWINDWTKVYDGTEEGGFKQYGLGRLNGLAALDDFIEHKHIALKPGLTQR